MIAQLEEMIRWADKDGDGQVMEAMLMVIIMIMMVIIMNYIQVSHMYHIYPFSFMVSHNCSRWVSRSLAV